MKEDLITYETAVLAKEKGFDWPVYSIFTNYGKNTFINSNPYDYNSENAVNCSRPTQALLQKWLRGVHNIDCWAQPYVNTTKQNELIIPDETYSFYVFKDGVFKRDQVNHLDFESALESGLIEALKLIEIQ